MVGSALYYRYDGGGDNDENVLLKVYLDTAKADAVLDTILKEFNPLREGYERLRQEHYKAYNDIADTEARRLWHISNRSTMVEASAIYQKNVQEVLNKFQISYTFCPYDESNFFLTEVDIE